MDDTENKVRPLVAAGPVNPKAIGPDEFMHRMRIAAGLGCVVGGLYCPQSRTFRDLRMAAAPDLGTEAALTLIRKVSGQLAVHGKLLAAPDWAQDGGSPRVPDWLRTSDALIGIGKPVAGLLPVIACAEPRTSQRPDLEQFVGLGLAYLSQLAVNSDDARSVHPEKAAQATMKMLSIGFFVLDGQCRIVYDGKGGEADGEKPWVIANGQLQMRLESERAALRQGVHDVVAGKQQLTLVSVTSASGEVGLVAITALSEPGRERLALVLFDTRQTDHAALRTHFFKAHALTKSESLIAREVLNGKTPVEMSETTGLSLATVRSYLKQIMAKTGTHRQSELVALYYSYIIPVGGHVAMNSRQNYGT